MGRIAIAGNFTAEPVADSLNFWLEAMDLGVQVEFAPFDQLFQQLLDPSSLLASNTDGVNVILLQLDRWLGHERATGAGVRLVEEFAQTLAAALSRTRTPHLLILTPPDPVRATNAAAVEDIARAEALLARACEPAVHLRLITAAELATTYPVNEYHDASSDALGQIPYTPAMYAALGTSIARHVRALRAAPYKVLVLDCDNTLWRGVVGEVGPDGVELDAAARLLHERVVSLQRAGVLICLASKNNEADVLEVFARRPELPVRLEHVTSHRINWEPKSANIRALAAELNLGLDSFIFVDDSAFELEEVRTHCPDVLTLLCPSDVPSMTRLLTHVWAFDRPLLTETDRTRSGSYRTQALREAARRAASTMDEFLEQLGLEVEIAVPGEGDWPRAAQMTLRTNQFNLTTVRRSEAELHAAVRDDGRSCRIVRVRDRFGDYGVVGLLLFSMDSDVLLVDTFLLSCRALARRAEHAMLAELGRIARDAGLRTVSLPFTPTQKNAPARAFLESLGRRPDAVVGETVEYRLSVAEAIAAPDLPARPGPVAHSMDDESPRAPVVSAGSSPLLSWQPRILGELFEMIALVRAVANGSRRRSVGPDVSRAAARDDLERTLLRIWEQVLGADGLGVNDAFLECGGTSILAVRMCALVKRETGAEINPTVLFQAATVSELAALLRVGAQALAEGAAALDRSLVPIQPRGTRPPLFCMHAGAGTVVFYDALARALGPDQPVYGLQARGIYGDAPPLGTIEEMAHHYLGLIRQVQPTGPYHLGGFCMGAMIAFEVAQQLTRAGEPVGTLSSFDGRAPGFYAGAGRAHSVYRPVSPPAIVPPWWTRVIPWTPRQRILRHLAVWHALPAASRRAYAWEEVSVPVTRALQRRRNRVLRALTRRTGGIVPGVFRRFDWYVGVQNMFAEERYRPGLYSDAIDVYTVRGRFATPTLGWQRWVTGAVRVHELEGELRKHRALLDQPMVLELARLLTRAMANASVARAAHLPVANVPTSAEPALGR